MELSQKIKNMRKLKALTQKQLAEKAGLSEISVRQYEKGSRNPKIEQLQKLAKALDCSPIELASDSSSIWDKWNLTEDTENLQEESKKLETIESFFNLYGYESLTVNCNEDGIEDAEDLKAWNAFEEDCRNLVEFLASKYSLLRYEAKVKRRTSRKKSSE